MLKASPPRARLWLNCTILALAFISTGCGGNVDQLCREGPVLIWLGLGVLIALLLGTVALWLYNQKLSNWDLSKSDAAPPLKKAWTVWLVAGLFVVIVVVVPLMLYAASNCPPGDRRSAIVAWLLGAIVVAVLIGFAYRSHLNKRFH